MGIMDYFSKHKKITNRITNLAMVFTDSYNELNRGIVFLKCRVSDLEDRISKLEDENRLEEERYPLTACDVYVCNEKASDSKFLNTEAILDVLTRSKRELHNKEVFDRIKVYNLHVDNISLGTVQATLRYLVSKEKASYGKKRGCFKIRNATQKGI